MQILNNYIAKYWFFCRGGKQCFELSGENMKKNCSGNSKHASNALHSVGVSGAVFLHALILCVHTCGGERTAYRSRFLPSPCGLWGLNSGPQGWQQVFLLPTLSRWSFDSFLYQSFSLLQYFTRINYYQFHTAKRSLILKVSKCDQNSQVAFQSLTSALPEDSKHCTFCFLRRSPLCDLYILFHLSIFKPCFKDLPEL